MYHAFKKIATSIIPKRILLGNEVFLRSIFSFNLKGKNHVCVVCKQGSKKFIEIPGDLLCPFCGSRSRTRRLYGFLKKNDLINGKVLHFSPSRSLYRIFNRIPNIDYYSTDYEDEFLAEHKYDITQIPHDNDFFDLTICYHILEHIENDEKAMGELARVLKPGGFCLVQTPFKEGDIYEDFSIKKTHERLTAFGQEDHVRIYSINGLQERLLKNGFRKVDVETFEKNEYYGFSEETLLICKK